MYLKVNELTRQQKLLLCAPLLFIFWPLLHFDWTPVVELRLDEDQLIHRLHQRSLPLISSCPTVPPNLVSNFIDKRPSFFCNFTDDQLQQVLNVHDGGHFKPDYCSSAQKVAILISFRDREHHLNKLIPYLHTFLAGQLIEYQIFVIEQNDRLPFNKGLLYNAGFLEVNENFKQFNCFVFHDVDLLPENQHNLYGCTDIPRHLSVQVSSLRYVLPYRRLIGGVLAIQPDQYRLVNGFSNLMIGWGGEDDELFERLKSKGLPIMRCEQLGSYTMLPHEHSALSEQRDIDQPNKKDSTQLMSEDGLTSAYYHVHKVTKRPLYTHILIDQI